MQVRYPCRVCMYANSVKRLDRTASGTDGMMLSTPFTLHPSLYTLHPTPFTLHPTPYTLLPTPHTPHPTPCTLESDVDLAEGMLQGLTDVTSVSPSSRSPSSLPLRPTLFLDLSLPPSPAPCCRSRAAIRPILSNVEYPFRIHLHRSSNIE